MIASENSKKTVDINFVQKTVANVAKYNPFELPDLIFKFKNKKNSVKMINGLKEENIPVTLIIWILAKECRNLNLPTKTILLKKLFLIDKIVKGLTPGDPWIELELFVLWDKSQNEYY